MITPPNIISIELERFYPSELDGYSLDDCIGIFEDLKLKYKDHDTIQIDFCIVSGGRDFFRVISIREMTEDEIQEKSLKTLFEKDKNLKDLIQLQIRINPNEMSVKELQVELTETRLKIKKTRGY